MSGYLNKYNLQGWLYKDARLVGEEGKQRFILNIMESKICRKRKNETDEQNEERKNKLPMRFLTIYCPSFMEWVKDFKKGDFIIASVKITEEKLRENDEGNVMIQKICNLDEVVNITQYQKKNNYQKPQTRGDVPRRSIPTF